MGNYSISRYKNNKDFKRYSRLCKLKRHTRRIKDSVFNFQRFGTSSSQTEHPKGTFWLYDTFNCILIRGCGVKGFISFLIIKKRRFLILANSSKA